jgi:dihydropteroate synthase
VNERLPESLGAVAACLPEARRRPLLVRVHDADETRRFLSVLARLGEGRGAG